ncbi:MAG: type IX secretion system membrane protein PorP/SprF [Flavobacteriaceae bacterium]|nr:type IX secretion system membrane protein PorP/SprF [Flavobacteriaceae bacterium]
MIHKSSLLKGFIALMFMTLVMNDSFAQQDPQYTQYMYNTMSVNPAYAGQRETLSVMALYRTQWVGLEGAPRSITFGVHKPLGNERFGLGLSAVSDQLGPTSETFVDANISYTIPMNTKQTTKFSFGIKAGVHLLNTDWSEGEYQSGNDPAYQNDINVIDPRAGAGAYLHSEKWYLGIAVPNFIKTNDHFQGTIVTEEMHSYVIGGYVFTFSDSFKFKPTFLMKAVSGSPLILDVSANALIKEKLTLGVAWRWDDAVSALAGFQISDKVYVGYAYDVTSNGLKDYSSGTHEIMLRFEVQKIGKILSPRFF